MKAELLREDLAAYAHEAWSGWMRYMFKTGRRNDDGSITLSSDKVKRWNRQMETDYRKLSVEEQQSDLEEADKMLSIFGKEPMDPDWRDWLKKEALI